MLEKSQNKKQFFQFINLKKREVFKIIAFQSNIRQHIKLSYCLQKNVLQWLFVTKFIKKFDIFLQVLFHKSNLKPISTSARGQINCCFALFTTATWQMSLIQEKNLRLEKFQTNQARSRKMIALSDVIKFKEDTTMRQVTVLF